MKNLTRVVWSEGMHLSPHHFQAQARYFEDSIRFATSLLWFAPYGLAGCALDDEALRNGTVSLSHARGLFPDGLHFDMPDSDVLPEPRNVAEFFSPIQQKLTIFLAIQAYKKDGLNCMPPEATAASRARFIAGSHSLHDDNTGRDDKPVAVARKNIRILMESEVTPTDISLPIARIVRDGTGHFIYDTDFIAPCLSMGASQRLMTITSRLIEILEEKSRVMSQSAPRVGLGARPAFSAGEIASFWFLHCLNSSIGPLRHMHDSTRAHPEHLYSVMTQLAGALCTFAKDSDPRNTPAYEHDRLTEVFGALDKHIRRHLNFVVPSNCLEVPLRNTSSPYYFDTGKISEPRCFGRAQWILAVRAALPQADLTTKTPVVVKVCSAGFIKRLVEVGASGLTLKHLEIPPADVSPNLETKYFSIERIGPCWQHIEQTHEVGIYVPQEIANPEMKLLVILDSKAD